MVFNNVIGALQEWCTADMERMIQGSMKQYWKARFAEEMVYKLGSLIDREFDDFFQFRNAVLDLLPQRILYALVQERSEAALALLQEAEAEFRAYLEEVPADVSAKQGPYYRVILGEERDAIGYAILEKWEYSTAYWYPLSGEFDETKLYLDAELLEPYWDRLLELLDLSEKRVYEYGESWYIGEHCAEVDDLYGYCGNEAVYVPKDLSWIIYFSHEGTVTFGGTIVPAVKELLKDEMEHWNKM